MIQYLSHSALSAVVAAQNQAIEDLAGALWASEKIDKYTFQKIICPLRAAIANAESQEAQPPEPEPVGVPELLTVDGKRNGRGKRAVA